MQKEKIKNNKGITLIALIITIIVMLILVGVTINVAINGGLIDITRESKFKTQVRQIQEQLQVKKAIIQASDITNSDIVYNIQLADLDIDQKLKDEFEPKLHVDEYGNLCYKEDITSQEIQWLQDLGIKAYVPKTLKTVASRIFDTQQEYDITEIEEEIKEEYPDATVYEYVRINGVLFPNIGNVTTGSLLAFNGEEKIQVTQEGVVDYTFNGNTDKVMTQAEAEEIFSLSTGDKDAADMYPLTINQYIGTEPNVIIPDIILGDSGEVKYVNKIVTASFLPATQKVALAEFMGQMIGWELTEEYPTYADIYESKLPGELYSLITQTEYTGKLGEKATISEKNELLQQAIISTFGVTEEDAPIEDDVLYIYVAGGAVVPKDTGGTNISSIYIPATVQYIEENAFFYQTSLETVNWNYSNAMQHVSSSAFAGCSNATIRITNRTEEEFNSITGKPWGAKEAIRVAE